MAKSKISYVSLDAAEFLSDVDYQAMTAEERGVYCTLIFYLYANGGSIECDKDGKNIALLCGCYKTGNDWLNIWEKVRKKFLYKNCRLYHKRVSKELKKAKDLMQVRRKAGLKGAEKKWQSHSRANGKAMATKRNDTETIGEDNISNSNEEISSVSDSLRDSVASQSFEFHEALRKILPSSKNSDRTMHRKVNLWLRTQIEKGVYAPEVFQRALGYAKESARANKPNACFQAVMQRELGYDCSAVKIGGAV